MKCHHTGAHVVKVHMAKATLFHKGFQLLLAGVHTNGLSQVTVAGIVTRDHLAELRQDVEGLPVVGFL